MPKTLSSEERQLAVNTIRMLAVDGVEAAGCGHPGLPMGAADYAFTLWYQYLRFNPEDPDWTNRDRFVLSAGHGSMLLYALLHLAGYDLSLDDLRQFRQWGSKTPGHPEYGLTPGVETTTGPLGQGFANGVGMAIAAKMAAARFNTSDATIVDHYVYGIVSDGDLMEGVASEAASLAGHLKLGNIIYFYDDNRISIEGSTELAFTEDRGKRFEAYGWQVLYIDGHDGQAAAEAIEAAQAEKDRPSLIVARTHIGKGSPNMVDSAKVHGAALGADEVKATKENLGWPLEPTFYVPDKVRALWRDRVAELQAEYDEWKATLARWEKANPSLAEERRAALAKKLPAGLEQELLNAITKPNATRRMSGQVIQKVAELVPYMVGGSADLAPSTSTWMDVSPAFGPDTPDGRNLHFGVREHAMCSILNGIALYGGWIPFGATFLVFADYCRPPIRLASLMGAQALYVFTHDSFLVGEDGPTHQPVEQIASLRVIPGMVDLRPADGPEVAQAWLYALRHTEGPTAMFLTRQSVPPLEREEPLTAHAFSRGAYALSDCEGDPDVVLIATGSEVQLAVAAGKALKEAGVAARVVSMPSRNLFMTQDASFREALLPPSSRKVVIEAGCRFGWGDVVGPNALFITQDEFGHSAPNTVLAEKLGFTTDAVTRRVKDWLGLA
ncbi:MAG: transketolase [Anaerolineae bacterium]|nr:transketolase [Anaerolineae bacterium]